MANYGTLDSPLRLSEVDFSLIPNSLQGITLTGDNYERGKAYGEAFAQKIAANVDRHMGHPNLPPM